MRVHSIILVLCILFSISYSEAQTTAIPDTTFENYLETHAADGSIVDIGDANSMGDGIANNGLVLTNRIESVVLLDVSNLGIDNLTGIEDFLALETLFCSNNDLVTLNVSNNTNLISLVCGSNSFTAIDVSNNINLETLNCSENQILDLDVSSNTVLKNLTASGNQLSVIDVSGNSELISLNVSNNRIDGELVVLNNQNLESLFCASNQIITLNLSANTLLKNLDTSDNLLTNLDLSTINTAVCPDPQTDPVTACQGPASINVSRNQLMALIVANGYNNLISTFNASDNPDLFCIQIDNGFTPNGWLKDDWAYYSENTCVDIFTYVPGDNFEQALINLGHDDVLDNLVLTANIDTITDLDISNASISNLVGIEDFLALEILDCSNNTLENLELINNTVLQQLNVSNNNLVTLEVNANTALVTLDCSNNLIGSVDLSSNIALTALNCSNNNLSGLDVDNNIALNDLDCSNNQIESLNVISNSNLTNLLCNNNNLFALNINNGNNNALATFNATNNVNLFCINVDDVVFANGAVGWQKDAGANYNLNCGTYIPDDNFEQALIDQGIDSDGTLNNYVLTTDVSGIVTLDVSSLSIADLTGIEDFAALVDLNCSNNSLSNLDLSSNTNLEILDCSINFIEALDFTTNTALTSLVCSNNGLRTLNVENGNNGTIATFNTTVNPNLYCINVDDAIVATIPATWQKDDTAIYDGDCVNNRFTLIPDALFEQALIDFGYDDIIDGQVLTVNIEHVQSIDVSDGSISDLTGIRDFKSLVELDCSGNFLDELDVSDMLFLERLNCGSNYLLTNDINDPNGLFNTTGTTNLVELYCAGNNLSDLDTSQNLNLEILDCADNNLDSLNVLGNTLLRDLNCSNNNLVNLDISNASNLENLNCDSNDLNNLVTSTVNNSTLTSLSCVNNELSDLMIDNYLALETLSCGSNELTQLSVLSNANLSYLSITSNQISDINLSNSANLIEAALSQNSLTQLDVTANTLLEQLNCAFNNISQLNVSTNTLLEFLSCSNNELVVLDISNNVNLKEANASSNMLMSLILSNNLGDLKALNVSNNQIEGDLDLSSIAITACVPQGNQNEFCPDTVSINLSNNLLSFVNIQNGINGDIINFNTTGNPNLECIQVDDANNTGAGWLKDEATSYNEDCNFGETYVPDDNFEQALIDLGYDTAPLNDYVITANIEGLISLDISGNGIVDLTGIEDFIALENLNCSNNNINDIDLSSNINVLSIDCSNNQLTELNLETNTALTALDCSSNTIVTIDLIANTNLVDLDISNNNFTSFTPSNTLALQVFNCDNNAIVELDFQQNQAITSLSCQSNLLETLNIRNGQNALLVDLNAQNNPNLSCIETDTGDVPNGANWLIDATAQFSIECFFGETFVPDDNFEQALIDLGYDSGALDDYVLTENIETISFLDISAREISDITGIESFISLSTLNISNNDVSVIDLSNNTSLANLNVSNNLISDIDISQLPNLVNLNVGGNSLSQINVDSNQNLRDLNVSNNALTSLDVSGLMVLEVLNSALNQLSALDVTQNPNLNALFCQSNMLVGDQLNLQNGNNENLQVFNALNNPDLGCILVDNPIAVIENTEGFYDNWSKDDTASYQSICEDADNDGVPNDDDLCPGTEFGATVDLFGCAVLDLPNDNFTIQITGETCLNSNDGIISIIADELYNYTITLSNDDFNQDYNFTNAIDILNLLAGTYEMCITVEEWPAYQSCYTIVVTQPDPLEVFSSLVVNNNVVSLNMSGSTSYTIEFNGNTFTTHNANISLDLQAGINTIKVTTDLECQGVYEEKILVGDKALVYPNPFKDKIKIFTGSKDQEFVVNIYTLYGQLVLQRSYLDSGIEESLDTSMLASGMYIISVKSNSITTTYKIIKE